MRPVPARSRAGWALRREGVRARGFSLLEVLIALALLLALVGLAWPTISAAGGSGAAREAEGLLAAAALRAKAEASLRGQVMELWAEGDGGRTLMVRQAPARKADDAGAAPQSARGPGVRVGVLPVAVLVGGETGIAASTVDESQTQGVPPGEGGALLAVFWPGGLSELHGSWSMHAGAYERRAGMNPWTGAMTFEDAPAKIAAGEESPDKESTDVPADDDTGPAAEEPDAE